MLKLTENYLSVKTSTSSAMTVVFSDCEETFQVKNTSSGLKYYSWHLCQMDIWMVDGKYVICIHTDTLNPLQV